MNLWLIELLMEFQMIFKYPETRPALFDKPDVSFVIRISGKFGILTIFIRPLFNPQYPLVVFLLTVFSQDNKSFTKFDTFDLFILVFIHILFVEL